MKKILSFAVAAAMLFTSCLMDETETTGLETGQSTTDNGLTKLTVKLSGTQAATRAAGGAGVEAPVGGPTGTTTFEDGYVFILKNDLTIYDVVEIASGDVAELTSTGLELPNPVPANGKVFVVGNFPDALDVNDIIDGTSDWTAICNAMDDVKQLTDYKTVPLVSTTKGTGGTADVIEPVAIPAAIADSDGTVPDKATVETSVYPAVSRIELSALHSNGDLFGFTVTGIFLSNYYPYYTLGGSYLDSAKTKLGDAINIITDTTTEGKISNIETTGVGNDWSTAGAWESDYNAASPANATANAGGSNVWAVNVAAGTLPYIVIRIEDVTVEDTDASDDGDTDPDTKAGPYYLLVNGYRWTDNSGGSAVVRPVSTLEAGMVYQLGTINFYPHHLGIKSGRTNVTVNGELTDYEGIAASANPDDGPSAALTVVSGAEGTVALDVAPNAWDGSAPVDIQINTAATLTATPTDAGAYKFSHWTVTDGTLGNDVTAVMLRRNPITFDMPKGGVTITANWKAVTP